MPMRPVFAALIVLLFACAVEAQDRYEDTVIVTAHAERVPFESLARDVVVVTRAFGLQSDFSLRGVDMPGRTFRTGVALGIR